MRHIYIYTYPSRGDKRASSFRMIQILRQKTCWLSHSLFKTARTFQTSLFGYSKGQPKDFLRFWWCQCQCHQLNAIKTNKAILYIPSPNCSERTGDVGPFQKIVYILYRYNKNSFLFHMKAGECSASYLVCSMCYFQPCHPLVDAKGIRSFCFRGDAAQW